MKSSPSCPGARVKSQFFLDFNGVFGLLTICSELKVTVALGSRNIYITDLAWKLRLNSFGLSDAGKTVVECLTVNRS